MLLDVIVYVSCGRFSELITPEILAVPIRFGKIGGDGKPLFFKLAVQCPDNIGIRVSMERTVRRSDFIIGGFVSNMQNPS